MSAPSPWREFLDQRVGFLTRRDSVVGAERDRERAARLVRFHHDHLAGAAGTHPLHRSETDRTGALDHRDVTESEHAGANGMEGHRDRFDLCGLLIGEAAVGLDDPGGRHGDARRETAVRRRERVAAERRQERHLAPFRLALVTCRAVPARRCHCDDDPITFGHRGHLPADRRHGPRPFVPTDRRVVRPAGLVGVDVGSADPAERDVDDDPGRCRRRVRELDELDGFLACDECCVHIGPSGSLVGMGALSY